MHKRTRKQVFLAVRIVVSLSLLIYLLLEVDLQQLLQTWRNLIVPLLLLAIGLQVGGVFLSSFKWWLLLRASGAHVPYLWAVRAYFIGQFFSNFLPTMIGGDAVRVYQLHQRIGRLSTALSSVLVERITGFLALTTIGLISLVAYSSTLRETPQLLWGVVGCLLAASAALVIASAAPWLSNVLLRLRLPNPLGWQNKIDQLAQALGQLYTQRRTLAGAIGLSFGYQLSWIATNYAAARALRLPVPFTFTALVVPLSDIVGLVPIFLNSLGAREGTFVALLALIGVLAAAALALSFLIFVIRLIVSLPGGVLYLLGGLAGTRRPLAEELQAVQQTR